jgi:hypothetical protein
MGIFPEGNFGRFPSKLEKQREEGNRKGNKNGRKMRTWQRKF